MPIEQRVVAGGRVATPPAPKITPRERKPIAAPEPPVEEKKKRKWPLVLGIVFGALLVGVAITWFFLRPMLTAEKVEPEIKPGDVVSIESMNINLDNGHYLRIGFDVQLSEEAEEAETARVLDAAISLYSGQKMSDVLDPAVRESLKAQLANKLEEIYGGEVMEVWLTDYVAQ